MSHGGVSAEIDRTSSPKISIVIPVYNGSNYLAEAIDSALNQTYPAHEVIVVNDGSTDQGSTERIARAYGDRIRYLEKLNGGVATALNLGIESMSGDYFSWLSHDDTYLPHKLSSMVGALRGLPDKHTILYSDFVCIDEHGRPYLTVKFDHQMLKAKPLYAILRGCLHGCAMLVPKLAFDKVGHFDSSLKTTQDYDLWFRMLMKFPSHHVPEVLICSRDHPQQDSKVHPDVYRETNELWSHFVRSVPEGVMLECEPTVYRFFEQMAHYLQSPGLRLARADVERLLDKEAERIRGVRASTLVSVVLLPGGTHDDRQASLRSIESQTHKAIEVVDTALESQARFLAYLEPGDLWSPAKLAFQLEGMLKGGERLSYTDFHYLDSPNKPSRLQRYGWATADQLLPGLPLPSSVIMLERRLFDRVDPRDPVTLFDIACEERCRHESQPLASVKRHDPAVLLEQRLLIAAHANIAGASALALVELLENCSEDYRRATQERLLQDTLHHIESGTNPFPETTFIGSLILRAGQHHSKLPEWARKRVSPCLGLALSRLERAWGEERRWRDWLRPKAHRTMAKYAAWKARGSRKERPKQNP